MKYLLLGVVIFIGALVIIGVRSFDAHPINTFEIPEYEIGITESASTGVGQRSQQNGTRPQTVTYNGRRLAGSTSPYLEFNQQDYEKALAEGKIIFLDFYANWCPICRGEEPDIFAGFNELTTDQVVGFRVNFKDDQTDDAEKVLAKEFAIPYQHTKVILKNGREVFRSSEIWDAATLVEEIEKAL